MKKKNPLFLYAENISTGKKSSLYWVEDAFTPDSRSAENDPAFLSLAIGRRKIFFCWRFFWLRFLVAVKSFYLQIYQGNYYFSLAENNRIRTHYLMAQRGVIYDRNGEVLVRNVSGFSLSVIPADLPKDENEKGKIISRLAEITGLSISEIEEKIAAASRYYWQPVGLKSGINYDEAMILKIASADLPGVEVETDAWRQYPFVDSFGQLIGYVGKLNVDEYEINKDDYLLNDNIGKTGLEKFYEKELRGVYGEKKVEIDSLGREQKVVSQTAPISGTDVTLFVDGDLQKKIYEILQNHLKKSLAAAVIVSDPNTGGILALVDYPGYDNNLFAKGISVDDYKKLTDDERNPLFMRSIAGEYPSGSTIKLAIASAALQEGVVNRNTTVSSVGGIWVGNRWFFPDWRAGGHGITNVVKAIADSVNTYFYYVGGGYGDFVGLGPEKIADYLKFFGFGVKTDIDLFGEKSGLVPTPSWKESTKSEQWYIGDTYHLAIGQGDLLVTPLQINMLTAAVANGGRLMEPHLALSFRNASGTAEVATKIVREGFVSENNLAIVREGMRQTIVSGSARSLSSLPVAAAGKTGTAQWNSNKSNHAWFTGFAPYDNPTFVITVLVEEGGEGSSTAVPIAKEIMAYWFSRQ